MSEIGEFNKDNPIDTLGAIPGLAGGIALFYYVVGDDMLHLDKYNAAQSHVSSLNAEVGSLEQAQQVLSQQGQSTGNAYETLGQRIAADETRASAITAAAPPDKTGQILEGVGIGVPTMLGCLIGGAALSFYIRKGIYAMRRQHNVPSSAN